MAEQRVEDTEQEPQAGNEAQNDGGDPRPGYILVETGSTKHPDAADSEDGKVVAEIGVKVGDNLKEAVETYGEDFVYDNYVRQVVVSAQGKVRRELDQGTPVSAVEAEFDDLDPTEKRTTVQDPQAQAMRALNKMSPEEKAKFRALLGEDA